MAAVPTNRINIRDVTDLCVLASDPAVDDRVTWTATRLSVTYWADRWSAGDVPNPAEQIRNTLEYLLTARVTAGKYLANAAMVRIIAAVQAIHPAYTTAQLLQAVEDHFFGQGYRTYHLNRLHQERVYVPELGSLPTFLRGIYTLMVKAGVKRSSNSRPPPVCASSPALHSSVSSPTCPEPTSTPLIAPFSL